MTSMTPDLCLSSQPLVICPLTNTKLYCLVTKVQVCKQLTQGCYQTAEWPVHKSIPLTIHYTSRTHNAHAADSKYTHTSTILFSDQSRATANKHTIILLEWKLSHKTHRLKLVHFLQILTTSVCTVKWKEIKLSTITYYAVYWRTHVVSLWDSSLNCLNPNLALFLRVGLQHVTSATQTSTNSTCLLVF